MSQDPLIGRQLGNFCLERLLGRGGMALVYYGWDTKLERPVAIKVIDARYRESPAYATRFIREARAVAGWRHENIVQIYHADEEDELYYFAMEYIDGLDLGDLLAQYGQDGELIPHDDALRLGRAIAGALDYAHEKGLIHRDVKPSNVLIASDGGVVLSDFGLAMDVQVGTLGEVFGSPHYIAPEQARSSAEAVAQSDLYSLGVILYEMLTGQVPFDDPSSTSIAVQHLTQPPPPPREVNPNLSEETEAVLLKALNKNPEERYQTGAELLDALESALQAEQPVPSPAAPVPSTTPMDEKVAQYLAENAQPDGAREVGSSMGDNLVGQTFDEYRLEALLGKGGMARVYRGLDVRLKRYVAIKVIDTPFRSDSEYINRFEREAQALAQLEHSHIVHVYRYGKADGLLYIAMQYVDGVDLGTVLSSYRADQAFIEPQEMSRVVREICQALDYAHEKGVIHRDIKPANVMLDKQGSVILTDFGLALLTDLGTRGEIFGSPHYMAPEQAISSANVVPQSDLYAVGIILYQMCTGELPFEAEDPLDVAMLHMTEPPRPPRELRPELSPELEAVILKALAQEPEARYQSGSELADALDQALALDQAPAAPPDDSTVLQRVAVELEEHPLPPIPAAVATPKAEPAPDKEKKVDVAAPPPAVEPAPEQPPDEPAAPPPDKEEKVSIAAPLPAVKPAPDPPPADKDEQAAVPPPKAPDAALPPVPAAVAVPPPATDEPATAMPATSQESETAAAPTELPDSAPPPVAAPAPRPAEPKPARPFNLPRQQLLIYAGLAAGACVIAIALLTLAFFLLKGDNDGTAEQTPTVEAVGTIPATESVAATAAPTFTPRRAPVVTASVETLPAPAPALTSFELLIARRSNESLFVINQADSAFPLDQLVLGDSEGAIDGSEWGLDLLDKGECVAAWKSEGSPKPPEGVDCTQVGVELSRAPQEAFWDKDFDIYYAGAKVATCSKKETECPVSSDQ